LNGSLLQADGGMMDSCQYPWIELYRALLEYDGADVYTHLLEPWPGQNSGECTWLAEFARRTDCCAGKVDDEDLYRLYAAFRVASLLLLLFQSGRADGSDYRGPNVTVEGYQLFHEAIGFRVPEAAAFHPFFHEIIGVQHVAPAETPVSVVEQVWPPMMLGRMMFCRVGCVVAGGTAHVAKEIAERSKLFWTLRRKDRPCEDQSHGWGSNSQWWTRLRRDYLSPAVFRYNIDGKEVLTPTTKMVDEVDAATMAEIVRHRCLVRTVADDSGLYPYRYTMTEAPAVSLLDPLWLTSTVVTLARGMRENGDFSAMPILADALQEVPSAKREGFAGCEVTDILNHCRDTTVPHVRGCWVIELVLGNR
jgi:hypothetical protein